MPTVLVIDDEPDILENVVDLLTVQGYDVISASTPTAGLDLARTHRPDLIVCDVMMPERSGHEVLQAVRQMDGLETTPFIFLTARSTPDDMREGMTLGADDYLTKPFQAADLLEAVEARLSRHRVFIRQREERLEELRRNMSTALPHEVRTPLAAIQGYAELLKQDWDGLSAADGRAMLDDILEATDRLKRLTENYALYTQLEAVTDPAALRDAEPTAVEGVIPAVATDHAARYARSADVQCEVAPGLVRLGRRYVRRVAAELVDNALKFSEPGRPVRVTGTPDGDVYRLEVADAGRGMRPAQLQRQGAFLQFDRAEHEQQGAGLGLALIHKICDRCGGRVAIDSGPERGTTVTVELPSQRRSADPANGAPRTETTASTA